MNATMILTVEQIEAVRGGETVSVDAPGMDFDCVIVRRDILDLLDDTHPSLMKRHFAKLAAEDWGDPRMNVYNDP